MSPMRHLFLPSTSLPNILFMCMSLSRGGRQPSHFQAKDSEEFEGDYFNDII
jgi:hypothetical protein